MFLKGKKILNHLNARPNYMKYKLFFEIVRRLFLIEYG